MPEPIKTRGISRNRTPVTTAPLSSHARWQNLSRYLALRLSLCILVLLAFLLLVKTPTRIVGDGGEYLAQLVAIAESQTVLIHPEHSARMNELLHRKPMAGGAVSYTQNPDGFLQQPDGSVEPIHFWFFSLLAAPFYSFALTFNLSFAHAFTLLHLVALAMLLELARRFHRLAGVVCIGILTLLSPLLWFINKAHTEFFTFICITATTILMLERRSLAGALMLALASTQNAALTPLAGILLVYALFELRKARRAGTSVGFAELGMILGCLFFMLLAPCYYLARYGTPSILMSKGFSRGDLITWQKVLAIFFDPDVGLYPNWPLGALIVIAGLVLLIWNIRKDRSSLVRAARSHAGLLLFLGAFTAIIPLAHASQPNFNSGGTVHVLRYATWYIGLHYLPLLGLTRLAASKLTVARAIGYASVCGLLLGIGWWNMSAYWPGADQVWSGFSPFHERFEPYLHIYDQQPEVFIERATGSDRVFANSIQTIDLSDLSIGQQKAAEAGLWAVASRDCSKLLVFHSLLSSPKVRPDLKPPGCRAPVDPVQLFEHVKSMGLTHTQYVRLPPNLILSSAAPLAVGRSIDLFGPESEPFLGVGWSWGEAGWRWTDGEAAEMAFRLSDDDVKALRNRGAVLNLGLFPYAPSGNCQMRIFLNGKEVANRTWTKDREFSLMRVPLPVGQTSVFRWRLEVSSPASPLPWSADRRRLGVAVVNMIVSPQES